MGLTICDLVRAAVLRYGDGLALVDERGSVTFNQMWDRASRFANALRAHGVDKGERVVMVMNNRREWIEVATAVAIAGGVRCRLNARDSFREFQWVLNDVTPRVVVAGPEHTAMIRELVAAGSVPSVELVEVGDQGNYEEWMAGQPPAHSMVMADDLYMIMHTSGTTGVYKGVMIPHRSWSSLARNILALRTPGASREGAVLHAGPLSHQADTLAVPGMLLGMRSVVLNRFEPERFAFTVERERITHTILSPTMINILVNEPSVRRYDLSSLQTIYYSASPIAPSLLRRAIEIFGPVFLQVYGSTESTFVTMFFPEEHVHALECAPHRLASCGRPTPFVDVRITDDSGADVPVGEIGEVRVRNDTASVGYWRQPEATAATYVDGWIRMGDLAVADPDGFITIVDRKQNLIISGGLNVYPRELEDVIASHPAIREVAVIGVPDDRWGEAVKACVSLKSGAAVTLEELQQHCVSQGLARYKKPLSLDVLEELPKTPIGKISRRELRDPYWAGKSRMVG